MIVLSLFDGMSCGQIALRDMGIIPEVYYASEIDKFAIAQTQLNFPETIQLGSVTELDATKLGHIDLLIGGSPCQSFSFAGKRVGMATTDKEEIYTLDRYLELKRGGFQFEGQSYLFWEYMRILNEVRQTNPDVLFLLENVEMGKKWEKILSDAIGIQGVHINSALVSAQTRKRIYWTNIRTRIQDMFGTPVSDIPLPKDRNIYLKDILLDEVDEKYYVKQEVIDKIIKHKERNQAKGNGFGVKFHEQNKKMDALRVGGKCWNDLVYTMGNHEKENKFISTPVVRDRGNLRKIDKSNCIVANYWKGMDNHGMRTMVHEERFCVRMQGRNPENPSDRSKGCPTVQRLEAKTDGKTNCLTSVAKDNLIYEGRNIPIHIPEASKKGYAEIFPGECFDATQLGSKTRRGRKMTSKCNCIMAQAIPEYYLYEIKEENIIKEDIKSGILRTFKDGKGFREIKSGKGACVPARARTDGSGQNCCMINERIRRLTPTECARLQTIPEWYKWECSETQQYKMLGNGWTVEVIKHIFSFLPIK